MAIGNSAYVRKNYADEIAFCKQHFDEIAALFTKLSPRHSPHVVFRVKLENHTSAHQTAAHGIEFSAHNKTWRPKSFYGGYAYMTMKTIRENVKA